MARGREWSLLEETRLRGWGLCPDQGPRTEQGKSRSREGRQMDTSGNREVKGLGGQTIHWWRSVSHLPRIQSFRKRQSCAGWRDGRKRGENHQQGEPQGQGPVPRCVTWTKRLAVQRTNETLRTHATSTGDLAVVRRLCVGETRKAPPSQKYTAWPQHTALGWGKGGSGP